MVADDGRVRRPVTRATVIGYGPDAREQAVRLRAIGWDVDVVVRPGGMSWIRAVDDGFRPVPAAQAALRASVVVLHVPESEQPAVWAYGIAPYLAPGALVVFARGSALYSGAVDPDPRLDVVLLTRCTERGSDRVCRIAVHHDATGRAAERALAFARAVYGAAPAKASPPESAPPACLRVETTTLDAEVSADLSERGAQVGGLPALLAEWDRRVMNPGHEPDQATMVYYERLRATVLADGRKRGAA